jgi:hypothetical protein
VRYAHAALESGQHAAAGATLRLRAGPHPRVRKLSAAARRSAAACATSVSMERRVLGGAAPNTRRLRSRPMVDTPVPS